MHRGRHAGRRQDTNDQLSTERRGADVTLHALHEAEDALVVCESQRARRQDVFGTVTHDIRSALTVIAMNASMIAETNKENDSREAAGDIVLAAARMERLLTDLLDVARIESGKLRVVKQTHDVADLLSEVHRSYRSLFESRGMKFVHERLSPTCKAPRQGRERITRVLAPSCIPLSCTVDFAADTTAQKKKAVQGGERGECGQRTGV